MKGKNFMKFGFVTCVQLGLSCMEAIYEIAGRLDLVISLKDEKSKDKSGRIFVDEFCKLHQINVLKIDNVNEKSVIESVCELDWLFIIGWSQIASSELLSAPKQGVLGMHPTLLPAGRGRASIPWAIIKGLEKTGVTLFKLDEGVDTGPIVDSFEIELKKDIDATELYDKITAAHATLMKNAFPKLLTNNVSLKEQDNEAASIWPGRKPSDGEIDLNGSVYNAERLIRAVTRPYPGAFIIENGKKQIIWSAAVVHTEPSDECIQFKDGWLKINESDVCIL